MFNKKKVGGMRGLVSWQLTDAKKKFFKTFAFHTGKTLSDLSKTALAEQIKNHWDYKLGIRV
ncbi:hypothetical protein SSU05_0615 [Streptococcus suis 05ZYH33]|nr:hypothetical protein SSU05_0615 [Streptococcus suis 05ZYH33]